MATVSARPPAKKVILRESGACRHDCPSGAAIADVTLTNVPEMAH